MNVGFFYVTGHGVSDETQRLLEECSKQFMALPRAVKRKVAMADHAMPGRGYFEVGEESTSGTVDEKEGLYFAEELPPDDPRPLHGPNLFPSEEDAPGLREAVLAWQDEMMRLSAVLMRAVSASIGLDGEDGLSSMFERPTALFRIFNYPPHNDALGTATFAVGEHSDYGFLTILKQDDSGGLQARTATEGAWSDVPPVRGAFVVNLGDALEYVTGGLLRATPHRVLQRAGATQGRLSYPFFFDPACDAPMKSYEHRLPSGLRELASRRRRSAPSRWDGTRIEQFEGTYGKYLIGKQAAGAPRATREALAQAMDRMTAAP